MFSYNFLIQFIKFHEIWPSKNKINEQFFTSILFLFSVWFWICNILHLSKWSFPESKFGNFLKFLINERKQNRSAFQAIELIFFCDSHNDNALIDSVIKYRFNLFVNILIKKYDLAWIYILNGTPSIFKKSYYILRC